MPVLEYVFDGPPVEKEARMTTLSRFTLSTI
jgi:hypothetical protein